MAYITVEKVCKSYQMGGKKGTTVQAVADISFELVKGDFAMVVGPSGGGKTTLLHLLGGMDNADAGRIVVDGKEITGMSRKQRTFYRRREVGFVFQFYQLMQNLTAIENIEIATKVVTEPLYGRDMLDRVGLKDRRHHFPSQLSGGEQQRVAIARALAKKPKLLLCDEPTGALDSQTGKDVLALLQETAHHYDMTVVMITHNLALIPIADQVIYMKNGGIEEMTQNPTPTLAKDLEW